MSEESIKEKIKELEEELSKTKYNKRTQHHIGLVKAKIASLKEKIESRARGKGKSEGYAVKKTGDGTAILIGFPSVGKSTLLNAITKAESKTGSYEFTTIDVVPGLLFYKTAKIQILDIPGIIGGASKGKGLGRRVLSAARVADLIIILLDIRNLKDYNIIMKELYDADFRLNQKRPDVKIIKTNKGGINISSTIKKLSLQKETIKDILNEFRIINADVLIREDINEDQLIDCIKDNRLYVPALTVINKVDSADSFQIRKTREKFKDALFISAKNKENLEQLKEEIFKKMGLIRIYLKQPGKEADEEEPLIIQKNPTIEDVCTKIHREFLNKFRFARVWGKSAKFPGQKFNLKHILKDEDVLELHLT
jgi:uncharacterized protein